MSNAVYSRSYLTKSKNQIKPQSNKSMKTESKTENFCFHFFDCEKQR